MRGIVPIPHPRSPVVSVRWQNAMVRSPRDQERGHAHGEREGAANCGDLQMVSILIHVQPGAVSPDLRCTEVRKGECFLLHELPAAKRKVVYTLDRPVVPLCTIL